MPNAPAAAHYAQPNYRACDNCGTADHADYRCPCACHGQGLDLVGTEFDLRHGGGVTRYRVDHRHRDYGYYNCVATVALSGSHHFLGSIETFSHSAIRKIQKEAR